jgi:hypothetical protein
MTTPDLLALDAAIEQELAHISEVPYNSHEICTHFAALVRKAFIVETAKAQPAIFTAETASHYARGYEDGKLSAQPVGVPQGLGLLDEIKHVWAVSLCAARKDSLGVDDERKLVEELFSSSSIIRAAAAPVPIEPVVPQSVFSKAEIQLFRQWGENVMDVNRAYLQKDDFILLKKVTEMCGMRVPNSLRELTAPAPLVVEPVQIDKCQSCGKEVKDGKVRCFLGRNCWVGQQEASPSVEPQGEPVQDGGLAEFTEYFVKNYPGPDTIIHKPEWHAPKIFRAAQAAIKAHPAPAGLPSFTQVANGLPEFDKPVIAMSPDNPYLWAMMLVDEGDGWMWAKHQGGALDDPANYEVDDDYDVQCWMYFPAAIAAQGAKS